MKTSSLLILAAMAALFAAGCGPTPEPDAAKTDATTAGEPGKTGTETGGEAESSEKTPPSTEEVKEEAAPVGDLPTKPKDGEEVGVLETAKGRIVVMFYPSKAPKHVENFKMLANKKFYDGTRFHRCIPGFMIQGGDPNSKDKTKSDMWGTGGNVENGVEVNVKAEFNDIKHDRGVLSTARSQNPDSASSQFFLMHQNSPSLDGQYTAFGRIVSGIEVVDKIVVTGDAGNNGSVSPDDAVVLKTVRIAKWPVK